MQFMRQLQIIKVTNVDNKVQTEMKKKYTAETCCRFLHGIICGSSNCKTNMLINLLKSPHGVCFENMYVYSKSLQQPKHRYLENLLTPIEEIGYVTFSNNNDVLPPNEALRNSIFVFDDMAWDKQDAIREYFCDGSTRGCRLLLSVSDICKDTEASYTR